MNGADKLSGVRGLPIGLPMMDGLLVHSQKLFLARKKESMLASDSVLLPLVLKKLTKNPDKIVPTVLQVTFVDKERTEVRLKMKKGAQVFTRVVQLGGRAGAKRANVAYSPSKRSLAAACYTRRRKLESHSALCSTSAKKGRHSRCNTRTCLLLRSRATKSSQTSKQKTAFSRLQHSPRKLGGRPSSTSKVRLRFRRSGPSTLKNPPIELQNSLESPPSPLKVGAFTTKTAKKDGAGVLSPPKPREKTGPAVCHHHFRCVCARHHQMWVFLCRHQKREFFVTTKTERKFEVTTKSGCRTKSE